MSDRSANAVLDQFLAPVQRCLSGEAARQLIEFRIAPETRARVTELAENANEGELTPEERAEYEDYVDAGDMIAILQAKTRALLADG